MVWRVTQLYFSRVSVSKRGASISLCHSVCSAPGYLSSGTELCLNSGSLYVYILKQYLAHYKHSVNVNYSLESVLCPLLTMVSEVLLVS